MELDLELDRGLGSSEFTRFRLRLANVSSPDPSELREFCSLVEILLGVEEEFLLGSSSSVKGEIGAQGLLKSSNDFGKRPVP